MANAPALASTASITLRNTNTGPATAANTFNKTYENICVVTKPAPDATFGPANAQRLESRCLAGAGGVVRYRTTTGKECTFAWTSIPQITVSGYKFTASAKSTGPVTATCRSIFGSRDMHTGDMAQTFEMQ